MIADITRGTQALARALSVLNKPGVRIYVIMPLLINLLLFGALVATWAIFRSFAGRLAAADRRGIDQWLDDHPEVAKLGLGAVPPERERSELAGTGDRALLDEVERIAI